MLALQWTLFFLSVTSTFVNGLPALRVNPTGGTSYNSESYRQNDGLDTGSSVTVTSLDKRHRIFRWGIKYPWGNIHTWTPTMAHVILGIKYKSKSSR
ncbi:hypothetical protein K474DRAFT_657849 [Panus rudis PR-1116 ss-1]|nr:hypothetical protein K474DRAFT_657849 [Panus rudis PR-1116 ss-1]